MRDNARSANIFLFTSGVKRSRQPLIGFVRGSRRDYNAWYAADYAVGLAYARTNMYIYYALMRGVITVWLARVRAKTKDLGNCHAS